MVFIERLEANRRILRENNFKACESQRFYAGKYPRQLFFEEGGLVMSRTDALDIGHIQEVQTVKAVEASIFTAVLGLGGLRPGT